MALTTRSRSKFLVSSVITCFPSRKIVIRSEIIRASSRACEMKMTETPRAFRCDTKVKKCSFSSGVSDAVGSSKMMILALFLTALAISIICFFAAPSRLTTVSGSTSNCKDWKNCCASILMRRIRLNAFSCPRKRFCAAVIVGTRLFSWKTIAMPRLRASTGVWGLISKPSRSIFPAFSVTTPAMTFVSVDLPAPFSPKIE